MISNSIQYNKDTCCHMSKPPYCSYDRNAVCLLICFSYLLTQTLCPKSPQLVHIQSLTIFTIIIQAHSRLVTTITDLIIEILFSLTGSYPSSSSKDPSACFQIFHHLSTQHHPLTEVILKCHT
jgi:hypothetical protein